MKRTDSIAALLNSRKSLVPRHGRAIPSHNDAAEGGCGVIGIASSEQIAGRHLLQSLIQMRNRGNGKGGGIAAVGLVPEEFGVSQEILETDYLLVIAFLDPAIISQVEDEFIHSIFTVDHASPIPQIDDFRSLEGLDVQPPHVFRYFVRLKAARVDEFITDNQVEGMTRRQVEDEIVYQNSYRLNDKYYSATGEKQAFVLSHGKNMLVLKMVGYGDDVIRYYQLEDLHAHVWIGHHRYPTKGKVWHPGGAHPFVGLNEALVHNGDFANYASICEYLGMRRIYPLFLTDTEVSVQVFDLLHRIYGYPLEYVIEAMAPTTERDFTLLPPEKQHIYDLLQTTHIHSSPDGPWFFLIAQNDDPRVSFSDPGTANARLIGITDTSMLRPQVFAWQQFDEDGPAIGFAASEKQAIDAALESLASEDPRFWTRADRYWNARGGSHTDGGAFIFTVAPNGDGPAKLTCTDKFGQQIRINTQKLPYYPQAGHPSADLVFSDNGKHEWLGTGQSATELFSWITDQLPQKDYAWVLDFLRTLEHESNSDESRRLTLELLTLLMDRHYPTGELRRSSLLSLYDKCLAMIIETIRTHPSPGFVFTDTPDIVISAANSAQTVVIDARGFPPEGKRSLAREIVRLHQNGFHHFIIAHARGHRFIANGLGGTSQDLRIDVFGASGDYLGSGIDGAEVHVHGNAQDQLAQIMKDGKLVVHGDVGQTFMYAAKGGEAYVLGNAAGRPLINAVGKPRVVINGSCLDYLAESFMAGDPLNGGGFVILNGLAFDEDGQIIDLDTPYPGGNLFSLASGGAIYVRDPFQTIGEDQLNGGVLGELTEADWEQIHPYLVENERLFGIPISRLLEVDGRVCNPAEVYRKITPKSVRALQAEEAWVRRGKS